MELRVPGDKSISHRALLLAALAEGESRLTGLLAGDDTRATAEILRALGVDIPPLPSGAATGAEIRIRGVGLRGLRGDSGALLDCGNSGTTARLLMGVLGGLPLVATLDGDASLRSRPMRRVTLPLSKMGARFEELGDEDRLPIRIHGGALQAIDYDSPVASAQVKSALLLAGVTGGVFVLLTEPGRSRDHTERMLRLAGASVLSFPAAREAGAPPTPGGQSGTAPEPEPGEPWRVELRDPPTKLLPLDFRVPGDFSSAAFPIAFALMGGMGGESLVLRDIGLNETRTGLLPVLARMGAEIDIESAVTGGTSTAGAHRHEGAVGRGGAARGLRKESAHDLGDAGEPTGDLVVRASRLRGTEVGAVEVPGLIDEIPILAALAARAEGTTRITGAAELRVKESDRLAALAVNLRALGVAVEELPDGLEIEGSGQPLAGSVRSFHDHRVAMAFGVLGALPGNRIEVEGREVVDVSYPGFWEMLRNAKVGG